MADPARRARRVLGLALASVLVAGYGTRGNLPDHIKTVAVPIFKNRTLEPGVESVVNAFSSGGRVRVVPLAEADAILEGEVVGYSLEGLAFDRSAIVRAYRLRLTLNVEFVGLPGGGHGVGHGRPRAGGGAPGRNRDRAQGRQPRGGPLLVPRGRAAIPGAQA